MSIGSPLPAGKLYGRYGSTREAVPFSKMRAREKGLKLSRVTLLSVTEKLVFISGQSDECFVELDFRYEPPQGVEDVHLLKSRLLGNHTDSQNFGC